MENVNLVSADVVWSGRKVAVCCVWVCLPCFTLHDLQCPHWTRAPHIVQPYLMPSLFMSTVWLWTEGTVCSGWTYLLCLFYMALRPLCISFQFSLSAAVVVNWPVDMLGQRYWHFECLWFVSDRLRGLAFIKSFLFCSIGSFWEKKLK